MRKRARLLGVILAGCVAFTSFPTSHVQAAGDVAQREAAQTKITGLTTNYQTNPLGIEPKNIRFGWQMDSTVIGAKQTAYQVKVFAEDQSLVWDSGKVESSHSTGIACEGTIAQRSVYHWEVTVWDQAGSTHMARASFETGVSDVQEWKDAEFICMNKSRLAPAFRTEQAMTRSDVKRARLYITALGAYEAYVNGNRAGEYDADGNLIYHHMNPGYGNKDISLGYQTYDVTKFLSGANSAAVAVSAGTGWYNGMDNAGVSSPAVKALLMIDYADGSTQVIKTNTGDWKGTLAGGITANGIYYGEDYNAVFAKELGDYTQTGYDDSKWVNAGGSSEESSVTPCIVNDFAQQTASYVRLLVHESGPADNNRENLLQIMELELLDAEKNNIVNNVVPEISNTWSPNGQWSPSHLTDGDFGLNSDKGYTSTVLGNNGQSSYSITDPISITFHLGETKNFNTLKLYPRTAVNSVLGSECANYPKRYTLQISQDGSEWTDVDLNGDAQGADYLVESLRNTELYPETVATHYDTEFGGDVTAKKVRISVSQVGPANEADKENRLQIMELELWNGMENVAAGKVPVISSNFEYGTQWLAKNLTDGDYGTESDNGYTSEILDTGKPTLNLDSPITIEFDFDEAVTFSSLRVFPRSKVDSVLGGIYANYPKVYTVSVSEDGTKWTELVSGEDKGMIRKQENLRNMRMSTAAFPGVIRAQTGLPGRMTGEFDQNPVSAVVYSGTKPQSEYRGGEIDVLAEYKGADMFANGITLAKGQTMVVNMGQNLTAVPNIRFSAPCGTRAVMRFAEMLNDGSEVGNGATQADGPKGSIYQKSLRNARSQATYVFSGDGVETYQPSMSFFGYQYVEITASDDMVIYGLTSKGISSVSRQLGQISTNNEDVNKLFQNVLFGQLSNYYTTPTDCNQRDERLSWTGDTQAFAQTAVYNFNSYAFLKDMQEIFDENTMEKGYVAAVTDHVRSGYFSNWAAGWSDVLIIVPWTLYLQTGDVGFLEDNWEAFERYMTFLRERERGENQCYIPGDRMNYGDWLAFQGTSIEVIFDYYYGYMNQIMSEIAGILGKTDRQEAYQTKFEGIKEKFIATHVTFENGNLVIKSGVGNTNNQFMHAQGKGGVWENNSQTALLWMLKLGFYNSDEMREAATKLLIENIKNENPDNSSVRASSGQNTLSVGFLGSNVIAPVLSDHANAQVSYDLLLQEGQPSWLYEVKAGATTVWERWNSYSPGIGFGDSEMNSFNHYAYGSVVEWMYRYMAGICASEKEPGFKHIILQPTLDTGTKYNDEERINKVEASYDSVYGMITSSWNNRSGKLSSYSARIPANTTASLYLPVEEVDEQQLPKVSGVTFKGMTKHNGQTVAEFALESGGYEFEVSDGKVTPSHEAEYDKVPTVSLSECQIGSISKQYYNGKKKTPKVAVMYQGKALANNIDYTVSYQNNTKIGKATVILKGKGNYSGTVRKSFTISVKKNAGYTVGNYKYKITNAKINGKGTVSLVGVKNSSIRRKLKKITVPSNVKIGGKSFRVTAIGDNAFKSCGKAGSADIKASVTNIGSRAFYNCKKLKKITIRSTKLKKAGKNALKNISSKAVIQVPRSKLKTYKKTLKGKGQKKTVKIISMKK